ncbi:tRNA pseudouridine(55) synthase TruB [Patescibacteria group bacterium]|nr:tRNA pseudouridine(55) synthase TruB [Patescibacteria group bacterium]
MKDLTGILLVNKPPGPTSHDMVGMLRRITGVKKIGHAGTLDPFANGLLICLIGRGATKKSDEFMHMDKEYVAVLSLGVETDTYDREGKIVKEYGEVDMGEVQKKLPEVLNKFIGTIMQEPPMFSAKKIKGKKLYELAREGKTIKRTKVPVEIASIEVLDIDTTKSQIILKIACGSGTYIRSLAYDIGRTLGVGAYLEELERTRIGQYLLKDAMLLEGCTKEDIKKNCVIPDSLS